MLDNKAIIPDDVRDREMESELADNPRFIDLLTQRARKDPDATALLYCRGVTDPAPVSLTHDALMGSVKAAALRMRAWGVGGDDVVAILSPACPATVVAILAAAATGVAMPLNLLFTREAIVAQMNAARAKVLVVPPPGLPGGLFERVEGLSRDVASLERVVVAPIDGSVSFDGETLAPDPSWRESLGERGEGDAKHVSVMLPTGGTTGHPKIARR